ncbi:transcriptional regulator [Xenorhabdus bovienii]|uniref:helix-turn-helix transcriptional regulator n=1 Tax=Xenorhabdus bovienii TaxID=40576 RepID=UPI0023B343CC|nr:helix-turn-helix transcriptional regulator [Xenorhabdus bovienii]MDE9443434.1 transcriptional regulator [Xenorhabdus bovienii]MDE9447756.1 transcriptional regulator [Xenorhabdus bovienii]
MYGFSPQKIVRKLIESGFTQAQLAERTGVSQSTLSRIFMGTGTDPRLSTVRAIEKFYNENVKDKA